MRAWLQGIRRPAPTPDRNDGDAIESGPAPLRPTFDAIYRGQLHYVLRTAWRVGIEREHDRDDIAAEVFLVVFRRLKDYDPTLPIEAWLAGITWRVARRFRQLAHNHRLRLSETGDSPDVLDEAAQDPEQTTMETQVTRYKEALIQALIQTIPEDRRIVLVMHIFDGIRVIDIARALDIPKDTAGTRLKAARRDIKAAVRRLKEQDRALLGVSNAQMLALAPMALDPAHLIDALRTSPAIAPGTSERLWLRLQNTPEIKARGGLGPWPGASVPSPAPPAPSPVKPLINRLAGAGARQATQTVLAFVLGAGTGAGAVYALVHPASEAPIARAALDSAAANEVATASTASSTNASPTAVPEPTTSARSGADPADAGSEAGADPGDSFDTDAALMKSAAAALGSGNGAAALAQARRHAKKYPASTRGQEREAIIIRALALLGQRAEAETRAASFRQAHPTSLYLGPINAILKPPPKP
jgi:RNA polymerase sigma-70 factor (ECF subfamily)